VTDKPRLESGACGTDLQPDDERPSEVSVNVEGMIQPVEHMRAGPYDHVTPELGAFFVLASVGSAICSNGSTLL